MKYIQGMLQNMDTFTRKNVQKIIFTCSKGDTENSCGCTVQQCIILTLFSNIQRCLLRGNPFN